MAVLVNKPITSGRQNFTAAQKSQARSNIDAIAMSDVQELLAKERTAEYGIFDVYSTSRIPNMFTRTEGNLNYDVLQGFLAQPGVLYHVTMYFSLVSTGSTEPTDTDVLYMSMLGDKKTAVQPIFQPDIYALVPYVASFLWSSQYEEDRYVIPGVSLPAGVTFGTRTLQVFRVNSDTDSIKRDEFDTEVAARETGDEALQSQVDSKQQQLVNESGDALNRVAVSSMDSERVSENSLATSKAIKKALDAKVTDAPSDGKTYVRKDCAWAVMDTTVTESEYAAMEEAGTLDPDMRYVVVEDS